MTVSDDRINHLAHLIQEGLLSQHSVDYPDPDRALREIKAALRRFFEIGEEADQAAREKIASLKRGVAPGSREWEVLYQKYYQEELVRRGRG